MRKINLGRFTFKEVENFKYLGVNVNERNERSTEIKEQIQTVQITTSAKQRRSKFISHLRSGNNAPHHRRRKDPQNIRKKRISGKFYDQEKQKKGITEY
jgi:hypothetical protein